MLNASNVIVWIQLRLVGLTMLSAGLLFALLRPNMSAITLEMAVSEDLQAAHTC